MKRWMMAFALLAAGCGLLLADPALAQSDAGKGVEGVWQGKLDAGGMSVTMIFKIIKGPEGKLSGTVEVPGQSPTGIPLSDVRIENDSVRLEVKAYGFVFTGKLGKDS